MTDAPFSLLRIRGRKGFYKGFTFIVRPAVVIVFNPEGNPIEQFSFRYITAKRWWQRGITLATAVKRAQKSVDQQVAVEEFYTEQESEIYKQLNLSYPVANGGWVLDGRMP